MGGGSRTGPFLHFHVIFLLSEGLIPALCVCVGRLDRWFSGHALWDVCFVCGFVYPSHVYVLRYLWLFVFLHLFIFLG